MFALHVTEASLLETILNEGLKASIGPRSKELGETVRAVYLFPTEDDLIDGLGNWLGDCLDEDAELAVLAVNVEGFTNESEVDYEIMITSDIPLNRIRFVRYE